MCHPLRAGNRPADQPLLALAPARPAGAAAQKKTLRASEQEREDVAAARAAFREAVGQAWVHSAEAVESLVDLLEGDLVGSGQLEADEASTRPIRAGDPNLQGTTVDGAPEQVERFLYCYCRHLDTKVLNLDVASGMNATS
jgi:hypothetical protein